MGDHREGLGPPAAPGPPPAAGRPGHLIAPERQILPVRRLSSNGLKAWKQAVHKGYEGLVGKDPESPYVGGRTLKWLKVKQAKFRAQERGFYKPDKPLRDVAADQPTGRPLGS